MSQRIHGTSRFVAGNANDADNVNQTRVSIDNTNTINRIIQINRTQVTNSSSENEFFNGSAFDNNNNFESLILPAGTK